MFLFIYSHYLPVFFGRSTGILQHVILIDISLRVLPGLCAKVMVGSKIESYSGICTERSAYDLGTPQDKTTGCI